MVFIAGFSRCTNEALLGSSRSLDSLDGIRWELVNVFGK